MQVSLQTITWVILAGGEGRRMSGRDKGLLQVGDTNLVDIIATKIRKQLVEAQRDETLLISANRNLSTYEQYAEVISDLDCRFRGPLAGIERALASTNSDWVAVMPCDSPNIPEHYVQKLVDSTQRGVKALVAYDGEHIQPVFCLIKRDLLSNLQDFLQRDERKVGLFFREVAAERIDFSDNPELFVNINTPDDLTRYITSVSNGVC
jgi:molybdopterin-guanine dinucleotide biosynthesis protein A